MSGSAGPVRTPTDGAETLADAMSSRWSPSIFDPTHEISGADLERLLQAARWSPSLGNTQPWSFVVAPRGSAAHTIICRHLNPGNDTWVPRASVVLLGATQVGPDEDGKDVPDPDYARYDLGQSVAHLTLQAQSMALSTHQFAGYDRAAAGSELGVPDHVQLLAGIAVGVPADEAVGTDGDRERQARPRSRRPLADLTHTERWDRPWSPT